MAVKNSNKGQPSPDAERAPSCISTWSVLRGTSVKKCNTISEINAYIVNRPILQGVVIIIGRGRRLRPTTGPVGRGLLRAPIGAA